MSFWTGLSGTNFRIDWADIGGIRTRFLEAGSGPQTVVFLHGVGGHLETFVRNVAAHASQYRVLVPDLLGHGYTDKPDQNYELPHYVDHLLGFLDARQAGRIYLAGTSLGGWISARIAAQHPERVAKLALVSTAGLTASASVMNNIRTLTTNATSGDRESVRKRLQWVIKHPDMVDEELIEARWQIYRRPEYQAAMPRIMCLQDMETRQRNLLSEAELGLIRAKSLVVWTKDDPTGDIATGQRYAAAIPGAEFVVFEESAHMPQFEEPERFNRLMLRFWAD